MGRLYISDATPNTSFRRIPNREWFEAAGEANLGFYRSIDAAPLPDAPPKLENPEALVPERNGSPVNTPAIAPRVDAHPAGADWKRFAIFRLDRSGRPELLSDTNLSSEADRFETLGYLVSSTTANGG
jgi:hypothetical protein